MKEVLKVKMTTWVQLIFLIGIIGSGIFFSNRDRALLKKCSKDGVGYIVDKYRIKKRGYFIKYKYTVNTIEYFSSESLTKQVEVDNFLVGGTLKIKISCSNPSVSKFVK